MKLRNGFEKNVKGHTFFGELSLYSKADYFRIMIFFPESAIYLSLSIGTQLPLAEMID